MIPLEYTELFIELDINAMENLVALEPRVHNSVDRIWTLFRTRRTTATAAEIKKIVDIVNQYYRPWFNKVYKPTASAGQLASAEASAQAAVNAFLKRGGLP